MKPKLTLNQETLLNLNSGSHVKHMSLPGSDQQPATCCLTCTDPNNPGASNYPWACFPPVRP